MESLDAGEEAFLQVDEDELAAASLGLHSLRVVGEELGEGQFGSANRAEGDIACELVSLARLGLEEARADAGAFPFERDAEDAPCGEVLFSEGLEIALEPADHHGPERPGSGLDGHAAREALGIEHRHEGAEAVGVSVVGSGGEEESVLEARADLVADHARHVRVDRILTP